MACKIKIGKSGFVIGVLMVVSSIASGQTEDSFEKRNKHRLIAGMGLNIPFEPTSANYELGFGLFEQYEFLLGDHFSLVQSLGFNYLAGKRVNEYYENQYVKVEYENFYTVPLQFGVGYYFGAEQKKFFILFEGGFAFYQLVRPAYPEVNVNGNVVKEAIPRTVETGTYHFFTPEIGWVFNRLQVNFSYQTHIENDANVGIARLGLAYNFFKD